MEQPDPYEFGSHEEWMEACARADREAQQYTGAVDCSGCGDPISPEDLTSDCLCLSCLIKERAP